MFRGDLIIDGYNLLHAAGFAAPVDVRGALERSGRALLGVIVSGLTLPERRRTTVVFDAPIRVMGPSPPQEVDAMRVLFADCDGDADSTIERLIQQNSAPRRLWVVSSDRRLQKAARRRRAKPIDSEAFLKRLARRAVRSPQQNAREPAIKHAGRLPPGEVEAWLQLFGMQPIEETDSETSSPPPERAGRAAAASAAPERPSETEPHVCPPTPLDCQPPPAQEDDLGFWKARFSELEEENG